MTSLEKTILIDCASKIHNLPDIRRQVVLTEGDAPRVLAAAWVRWGGALVEKLVGDYALVLRDEDLRLTYLAREPLGVKPLYYRVSNRRLDYGFSIPQLLNHCREAATKDVDWAAAYMLNVPFSQTDPMQHALLESVSRCTDYFNRVWVRVARKRRVAEV